MDALAALLGGVFEALFAVVAALLEVVASLLVLLFEFLFLLVFQGRDKANARYRERQEKRAERKAEKAEKADIANGNSRQSDNGEIEPESGIGWIGIALALFTLAVAAGAIYLVIHIGKQRIKQTKLTVDSVAQRVVAQIENREEQFKTGLQVDLDAWGRPVELLVDDYVVGQLIVVRSFGSDGKKGGGDDIFASEFVRTKMGKIAGKLVDMGADAIKDKARELLDRKDAESE